MKTFEQFMTEWSGDKPPRKGSIAWNAAQKRKKDDQSPERVKFISSLGNKDHMVGNAKVIHKESVNESIPVGVTVKTTMDEIKPEHHHLYRKTVESAFERNDVATLKDMYDKMPNHHRVGH